MPPSAQPETLQPYRYPTKPSEMSRADSVTRWTQDNSEPTDGSNPKCELGQRCELRNRLGGSLCGSQWATNTQLRTDLDATVDYCCDKMTGERLAMMAYEVFARTVRRTGAPSVTLTRLGRIALSKSAYQLMEKQAVEYVLLMWDPVGRKVALKPSNKKDGRAYELHAHHRGGAGFSAVTFLEHIGFDMKSGSRQCPAEWNDDQGILEVNVAEADINSKQPSLMPLETVGRRHGRR